MMAQQWRKVQSDMLAKLLVRQRPDARLDGCFQPFGEKLGNGLTLERNRETLRLIGPCLPQLLGASAAVAP